MKYVILFSALALFSCGQVAEAQESDRVSYSLGVLLAQNLKNQGLTDLDFKSMVKGIEDVLQGNETEIDVQECSSIVNDHIRGLQMKQFEEVKKAGEEFLTENGKRSEVITTASGLQYEVIKEGTGPKPKSTDKVKVHYHGTTLDGSVFDSSVEKGEPAVFDVNILIQGWKEGLELMPVGSKYIFYIPYDLAYGEQGAGGMIKPFSMIQFEVELLGIE